MTLSIHLHAGQALKPMLVAAALAAGALSTAHAATVSTVLAQKAPEAAVLAADAEADGHVRVIVTFASPVTGAALKTADQVQTVEAQVTRGQDAILADHFGSATDPANAPGFNRTLTRLLVLPGFAINVTGAELDSLAADPRVVQITPDHESAPASVGPSVVAPTYTLADLLSSIGMPAAYADGGSGNGVAVAIVSTGVQSNHDFLAGKVVMEACFSTPASGSQQSLCPNGTSSQAGTGAADATTAACVSGGLNLCLGGTAAAGIAAGLNTVPSDGGPANGVAKGSDIVAVQIFHRDNASGDCGGTAPCLRSYESDALNALGWLAVHALNPSGGVMLGAVDLNYYGGAFYTGSCTSDFTSFSAAVEALRNQGIATIAPTGVADDTGSTSQIRFPACLSNTIAVAPTDANDAVASYANMSNSVDLLAPGGDVNGGGPALPVAATTSATTTSYANGYGPGLASAAVTGAFASIISACQSSLSSGSVNAILLSLTTTGKLVMDTRSGGGIGRPRIQVDKALSDNCSPLATTAIDPLTLLAMFALAGVAATGWQLRRKTA